MAWLGDVQQARPEHCSAHKEWLSQLAKEHKGLSRTSGTRLCPSARERAPPKCGAYLRSLGLASQHCRKLFFPGLCPSGALCVHLWGQELSWGAQSLGWWQLMLLETL